MPTGSERLSVGGSVHTYMTILAWWQCSDKIPGEDSQMALSSELLVGECLCQHLRVCSWHHKASGGLRFPSIDRDQIGFGHRMLLFRFLDGPGQINKTDEFAAVAGRIGASRVPCQPDYVLMAKAAGMTSTFQKLSESRDCYRKAHM